MTTTNTAAAQADLAFLRNLAEGGGRPPETFGKAMLSAGLIHGVMVAVYTLHFAGVLTLPPSPALHIVLPFAPSAIWAGYLVWLKKKTAGRAPVGVHRSIAAAFQSVGLVSIAVLPASALIAYKFGTVSLIFIHTMAVCAILGAAWYVAFRLLKRGWMLASSIGWLAAAALVGVAIAYDSMTLFFAVGTFVLFALMALPGWVLLQQARGDA